MSHDRETAFSVDAAHAADREKRVTYAPRPPHEGPDFATLRTRALAATRRTRAVLRDSEDTHG
jgi:hypothetical protein